MSTAKPSTDGGQEAPSSSVQSPQVTHVTQTPQKKKQSNKALQSDNHEVLSDAVAASGVNIRAEEEAMVTGLSISKRQIEQNTFLKPNQLHWFMNKTLEEQGIKPVVTDQEVSNLISASCEHYMTQILTDTIVMMRHRRHSSNVPKSTGKSGSKKSKSKSSMNSHSGLSSKSELSKALRDIASKHKDREEKRIRRRIFLGLEEEKLEEDLIQDHKQTNLTASLMMSGSKKKKYSWMQSSSASPGAINFRGDNGIRYREAREEQAIVLRDLIAALENRRIGVSNALLKGYARLRD
ncbi:hypothetical protein PICMEDRAFT_60655 [Pichia membranifaciens NRRL Y-2026]|uniref:Transcription initiation factor TFIID subunit 4 n=1 Tax=Pichia membranifaciens NRRL Y-2026 TaxID=763406 RepID=A0A1E3NDJ5_9ASCO|nr:hypothetical protein PICMEDRAFT_60655 [Pichia membranifaciens NRRL Y-2026]ODQ44192.1 hypothetical protein PICMEDRAFT_60655 [Pichia membranifaciens NRRL Y-2026]